MISHEIQVRVYTHLCYFHVYDISNDLKLEFHDYVQIFMHIAEIYRFWVVLSIFILSSMIIMIDLIWELTDGLFISRFNTITSRKMML